ncbi:MAG TPA: hypothetical protein DCG75_05415 [Bacteroidales bacterium]|nr:hypothetical protein [Bacteroidales bacterium]
MVMRYLLCIIYVISTLFTYAQEDSLKKEFKLLEQKLNTVSEPTLKIPIYKDIIQQSFPNQLETVIKYSKDLLDLSESLSNADAQVFALFYIAQYYFNVDDFEKAIEYFNQALLIYQSFDNNSQMLEIYHNLGLANQYLNNYDAALSYYQKAIEMAESIGNKEQSAISYQDIGTLYNDLQKYSLALYYYEKALEIYKQINNEKRIAAIYQNIGVLHYNWGDLSKSLEYYLNSLRTYERLQDKQNIAISLSNIGLFYEEGKNFSMALDYYQKALIIFEEIGYKPTLVYIFYNLGSIYRNIGNYTKSIEYFEKGLTLSKEISMKDYISYNYEALSGVYEDMGNFAMALKQYKDFVLIKDSLFNEEKHKQIGELEAKFQTAQHEKEIEFLKLDHDLKDLELKKKENQNLVLIISSLLALLIAFILFFFARAQKTLSTKLQVEIEEHKKTESELNQIKTELEDRVKKRTIDLEETNNKLLFEIEEHKKTMISLKIEKNRAEEADRLKTNFLANMSHEVRTPMNAITGFSQMLAFENLTSNKRRHYINMVQEGCNSLTNLIDDIVDFANIESEQLKIEKKEFNPHPLLEFLQDHYTNELVKRNKEGLILSYANENSENDIVIHTDPSRLKQIFSILIDNALKFTEKGHVEFGFTHPNNNEIQFFVRDTGIGIDEKHFDLIFERFRQVDEGTTKRYGGAGIGLSVAKKLVELMNGNLYLESTLGRGSNFFFNLPYNVEVTNENVSAQPNQFNWKNKLILIAEDKKINFDIIQETLSITDVDLLWAKNGQEAIQMVESHGNIDLILMDIQMPVMDGYECTKRIKEMSKDIPIIAQTAYALPQDSYKCFDAGCDDYISKPISLNQFLIKLNKYLS